MSETDKAEVIVSNALESAIDRGEEITVGLVLRTALDALSDYTLTTEEQAYVIENALYAHNLLA